MTTQRISFLFDGKATESVRLSTVAAVKKLKGVTYVRHAKITSPDLARHWYDARVQDVNTDDVVASIATMNGIEQARRLYRAVHLTVHNGQNFRQLTEALMRVDGIAAYQVVSGFQNNTPAGVPMLLWVKQDAHLDVVKTNLSKLTSISPKRMLVDGLIAMPARPS